MSRKAPAKRYGLCTGCKATIPAGPYFTRRCVRHLRLWWHNHDAIEILGPRKANDVR